MGLARANKTAVPVTLCKQFRYCFCRHVSTMSHKSVSQVGCTFFNPPRNNERLDSAQNGGCSTNNDSSYSVLVWTSRSRWLEFGLRRRFGLRTGYSLSQNSLKRFITVKTMCSCEVRPTRIGLAGLLTIELEKLLFGSKQLMK